MYYVQLFYFVILQDSEQRSSRCKETCNEIVDDVPLLGYYVLFSFPSPLVLMMINMFLDFAIINK